MYLPRLTILLLLVCSSLLHAQRDFNQLKSDILQAETEAKRLESIITLGAIYNRTQIDSIYYYADSLASPNYNNREFAMAGKQFLEALAIYHQGNLNEAIEKLEISRNTFDQLGSKSLKLRAMNFLGIAYTRTNEVQQALDVQNEMIELCGDDPEFASAKQSAYGNRANAYRRIGEYSKAVFSLEKAIELSTNDSIGPIGMSYLSLGQMLTSLRLHDRAIEAYRNVDIENFPSESVKGALYSGTAQAYLELEQLDSAYYYYSKSYKVTSSSSNWQQMLRPQLELAKIAVKLTNVEQAKEHLDIAESILGKYNFPPPAVIDLYLARIELYILEEKWDQAIITSSEFEKHVNDNGIVHLSKNGFRLTAELYERLGDTENALKYEKLNSDLDTSPRAISENSRIAAQRTQLALLEKDEIIEEESAQRAFYQGLAFQIVVISILSISISFFLYRYYRKEKSKNVVKDDELIELKRMLKEPSKKASNELEHITLKSKALIRLNELMYISSDGPYLEFYLSSKDKPEIDRNTLKRLTEELPSKKFIQVHRSHIVNIDFIKSIYSDKLILQNGSELKVSRSYKEQIDNILNIAK